VAAFANDAPVTPEKYSTPGTHCLALRGHAYLEATRELDLIADPCRLGHEGLSAAGFARIHSRRPEGGTNFTVLVVSLRIPGRKLGLYTSRTRSGLEKNSRASGRCTTGAGRLHHDTNFLPRCRHRGFAGLLQSLAGRTKLGKSCHPS
jgi:hypothetical protein